MADGASAGLINSKQVADLAGVRRPTVTTWAKRHAEFPEPWESGTTKLYAAADIVRWLDRRIIASKDLHSDEGEGTTYGQRFRRSWHGNQPLPQIASAADPIALNRMDTLFDSISGQVGGTRTPAVYVQFLLGLVFLQVCASDLWTMLPSPEDRDRTGRLLLRRSADQIDKALQRMGLRPGLRAVAERLDPQSPRAVVDMINMCAGLGAEGFERLLRRYPDASRLDAEEAFTPEAVARVMAELLLTGAEPAQRTIYDPYLRGGELLTAVTIANPGGRLSVSGVSPSKDTVRLAGMRLAVHGHRARLADDSLPPWTDVTMQPQADLVLVNPPFNQRGPEAHVLGHENWLFGPLPKGSTGNYAWLQYAYASLTVGGRAAVIMPNKATLSAPELPIRRSMVDQGAVECVIALPPGLFDATAIPATIWILRRTPHPAGEVLFIDATGLGKKGKRQRHLEARDHQQIVDAYRAWRARRPMSEIAAAVPVSDIRDRNYPLSPSDFVRPKQASQPGGISPAPTGTPSALASRVLETNTKAAAILASHYPPLVDRSHDQWQTVPLHAICDIQPGLGHAQLQAADDSTQGAPIVMAQHLQDGRILGTGMRSMPSDRAAQLAKYRLSAGDILCARVGSSGSTALVEPAQQGWIVGNNLLRLRPTEGLDPRYLLAFLQLPETVAWIKHRSKAGASAVASISREILGQHVIRLPSVHEQNAIGTILFTLDDQITAHRAYIHALEHHRQTVAHDLLNGTQAATTKGS